MPRNRYIRYGRLPENGISKIYNKEEAIGEEAVTIEDVYEPYLMQIGFLSRTPRGRCVTFAACQHLDLSPPNGVMPGSPTLFD